MIYPSIVVPCIVLLWLLSEFVNIEVRLMFIEFVL